MMRTGEKRARDKDDKADSITENGDLPTWVGIDMLLLITRSF